MSKHQFVLKEDSKKSLFKEHGRAIIIAASVIICVLGVTLIMRPSGDSIPPATAAASQKKSTEKVAAPRKSTTPKKSSQTKRVTYSIEEQPAPTQPISISRERLGTMSVYELRKMAEQAATSSDPLEKQAMLKVVIADWAEKDPNGALRYILETESGRNDLLMIALERHGMKNGESALNWLDNNIADNGQRNYLRASIFRGIAATDPLQAIALADDMPIGASRNEAQRAVVETWIKQDIDAVFNWIGQAKQTSLTEDLYGEAMRHYIDIRPNEAEELLIEMEPGSLKSLLAEKYAKQVATEDVRDALMWAMDLDPNARKQALTGIMEQWTETDANAAIDYIMGNPDYPAYTEILTQTVIPITYNNPTLLIERLDSMREEDQQIVTKRLAIALYAQDPESAESWIESMPRGPARDAALPDAVSHHMNSNLPRAFELASSSDREIGRMEMMERAATKWGTLDYEAAHHYIAASEDLNQDERNYLLKIVASTEEKAPIILP